MAQEDKQARAGIAGSGPAPLEIVCVDGEWYHCPGEYPQPCVGPFPDRQGLLDHVAGLIAVRRLSVGDVAAPSGATTPPAGAGAAPVVAS